MENSSNIYLPYSEGQKKAEKEAEEFTKNIVSILSINLQKCRKEDIKFIYDNLFYAYNNSDEK